MREILGSLFGIWRRKFSIFPGGTWFLMARRYDTREAMNASALESWDDEFPIAGVTKAPSRVVKPPRVAESPVQFECKVHSVIRVHGNSLVGHSDIVIGRVVAIHVKGEYITPDGVCT